MSVRVTINHLRAARMCGRAARPWFAEQGLSWNTFVAEGYDSEVLRATGDGLALKVIAVAEAEARDDYPTRADCMAKFNNISNFTGFPEVPDEK